MKGLGSVQRGVLRALHEQGPYPGSGWHWGPDSHCRSVCESLARRGLVDVVEVPATTVPPYRPARRRWSINDAGRVAIADVIERAANAQAALAAASAVEADERAAKARQREETARAIAETLERIRPMLVELGIHPDTVTGGGASGRAGVLMPAETVERLVKMAVEFDRTVGA